MKKNFWIALVAVFLALSGFAQVPNLSEGFEDGWPPDGWNVKTVSGTMQWMGVGDFAHSGTSSVFITDGGNFNSYLISPQVSVSENTVFSFYYATDFPSHANLTTFTVEITTDTTASAYTVLETINLSACDKKSWYEKVVDLSDYVGQNVFIIFHDVNNGGTSIFIDDIEIATCPSPKGFAVNDITAHTANVSWTGSEGGSYKFSYKAANQSDWSEDISLTEPTFALTDLLAETEYKVRVLSLCDGNETSSYGETSFTTDVACHKPDGLTISEITAHTATVSWNAVNGATSYKLSYKLSSDEEWIEENLTETNFDLTNLSAETGYYVKVSSDCGEEGISVTSDTYFTTAVACNKPTNLHCTALTNNSATITWSSPSEEDATSYIFSYKENTESAEWSDGILLTTTTYLLSELSPATSYVVKVSSDCGEEGTSAAAELTITTTAIPVDVPYTQNFEGAGFPNGFLVQTYGANNTWVIGSATAKLEEGEEDGHSMYISNDNGVSNNYTKISGANSWAILTVNFGDAVAYKLSFDYRVNGEANYDYLSVYAAPSSVQMPTVTIEPSLPDSFIEIVEKKSKTLTWTHEEVILNGLSNSTYNIIFHWRNDGSSGSDPAVAIDNISIDGMSCVGAYNLTASDVSTNGATINWSQSGSVSSWKVKYKKAEDDTWMEETVSESNITLTDLTINTQYQVFVESICGEGEPYPVSDIVNFKTLNTTFSVPYEQTFDGEEDILDFDIITYGGNNAWVIGSATSTTEDGKSMYISNDNGLTNEYDYYSTNSYAVLTVNFEDKAEYHLSFDYKVMGDGYYDYLSVYIAPATESVPTGVYTTTIPSTFVPLLVNKNLVENWTNFDIVLNDVQNSTKNIIFRWTNDDDDWDDNQPAAAIDNISITGSDCMTPSNLVVGEVTETTANISWSQEGEVSSWNVKYKPTTSSEWQSVEVSETSYTITGLDAGTSYNVCVEGICWDGSYPITVVSAFSTSCVDIDLSILEGNVWKNDFEAPLSLSEMCFNIAQTGSYYSKEYPIIANINYAHTGIDDGSYGAGSVLEFSAGKGVLTLPKFTDEISQLNLKLWYHHNGYSNFKGTIEVGVMTDPSDPSTFTAVTTLDASLVDEYDDIYYLANINFGLTELTGNDYYIAFKYNNTNNYVSWYIDDIEVSYVSSCSGIDVNSVAISNVTAFGATVDFTDLDVSHTAWKVYYKPVTAEEYLAENVENQTATLSGLLPETEYTVYVVTECDGVESELKSIAKTFTTDVACPAPTNVAFTKITENEATITWSSTENAGSWKVSYKAASDEEWSAEYSVTEMTYDLMGLEPATNYLVKIVADCDQYSSKPTQVSFYTTDVPFTVPYMQDFENGAAVTDFQIQTYGGSNAWTVGSATAKLEEGDENGQSMYVSKDSGATNSYDESISTNSYAILTINFGDKTEYKLSFDYKVSGGESNFDYLSVYVAPTTEMIPTTTSSPTIPSTFTTLLEKASSVSDWTHYEVSLTGVANTYQNIIFHWRNDASTGSQSPAAIDNISIVAADCVTPADVEVSGITSTTATISWSSGDDVTSWIVKYKKETDSEWQQTTVNTTSYSLTNLDPATTYQLTVSSVCGENNAESDVVTFKTLCDAIIVTDATPWMEDFSTDDALDCWTYEPYTWSYGYASKVLYHDGYTETSDYIYSPVFDLTGVTNPYVAFKYMLVLDELYEMYYDTLKVFYRTTQTDDWTELATLYDESGTYQFDTLALPNKSATYQISFYLVETDGGGVKIDDLVIFNKVDGEQPEPCDVPTDLTVTAKTQTTATITWDGSAALYELQLDGNAPQDVAATTYAFNDLTAGTTYTVKVRAVCSEETTSDWAIITFTTEEDETPEPCDAPTNLAVSELTQTTAVISWEGTAETYEVTVGDKAPVNVSAKSYTCSGLTANTTYTIKVRSICGDDVFSDVATTTFKTLADQSGLTDVENELSVKVYPNPTTENATLEIKGINGKARVIVTDVNGRVIDDVNVSDGVETITINSERYASGVYYVRVMSEGINKTTTLIKK